MYADVWPTLMGSNSNSHENFVKKWIMRQYWRVQQSQAFISMGFWGTTLTLLIWPYVSWRFNPNEEFAGLPATYWGLISIFSGVMVTVLLAGFVYDRVLGLWIEWRSVDTERNPFMTYALSPNWMMSVAMQAEILRSVSGDQKVKEDADWILEWCRSQAGEEIFARTVQAWDKMPMGPTPDFWFLPQGAIDAARAMQIDDDS